MDFWVVKNVTGRIMAGLRWWNYVDENGEARWIFESRGKDSEHVHSSTEIKIFWGTLVLTPLVWILFIFTSFWRLNFQWIVLPFIGILFTGKNPQSYLQRKVISNFVSGLMSMKPKPSSSGNFQTV
ncbi:unnamed protein product [Lepeophtheirus salmonis]|uniref:Golgi apparatus membrane protein TVP23 homolog n=1 Tax=Lepeophtheirus salmonis TaxID=72036 RepID=A0A7R8HCE8_LEPSM|nr:unnamed protein product [Lepeophtheirus salmonis]CAF3006703.1 unnamed protein product [Lepeophtheirus salmonis]